MNEESADRIGMSVLLVIFLAFAIAILASIPKRIGVMPRQYVDKGDPSRAPEAIQTYGCGSCHEIPGITGADGAVGPRLDDLADRSFLAGRIANTPGNLVFWIQHPQLVKPGVDMPELGVTEADARNIAAYLYSLSSNQNDLNKSQKWIR